MIKFILCVYYFSISSSENQLAPVFLQCHGHVLHCLFGINEDWPAAIFQFYFRIPSGNQKKRLAWFRKKLVDCKLFVV